MAQNRRKTRTEVGREILDYLEVPLRRPFHIAIPFLLVLALAVTAIFTLPKKYKSQTLILVESEKVPDSFVTQISTDRTSRHLQTIKQEILSRTRLERVVEELDPYGSKFNEARAMTVERMRSGIEINIRGNDAFSIEYIHRDPNMAMQVANRLATLFIEEATLARAKQVGEAHQFIESQLEDARRELEEREQALRRYKEQHIGNLPEQMTANLATLQRLQLEQQTVSDSLRSHLERQTLLEQQPIAAAAAAARPDGIGELNQLRDQLAALRTRYRAEHPDVRALEARISRMERELAGQRGIEPVNANAPGNAELEQIRLDIKNLRQRQADIDQRIATFQSRVESAPRTEQDIATLTRDYQKLNENYLALLNRKLEADMAAKLEKRWKGEQYRILDPANLPEHPVSPNKLLFLLAGIVLGLGAGIGTALAADFLDHSIKHVQELEELLPFPVLASIPFIETELGRRPRGRGGRPDQSGRHRRPRVEVFDRSSARMHSLRTGSR
jgi:polysaccharide chain length determinant protein (PEP-CTERM system associated)